MELTKTCLNVGTIACLSVRVYKFAAGGAPQIIFTELVKQISRQLSFVQRAKTAATER
jgi:hypothetical protein